jgi:hypothetical protein
MKITVKQLKQLIREAVRESLDSEHVPGTYAHYDAAFDTTQPRYVGHGEEGFYRHLLSAAIKKMAAPGMTPEDLAKKLGLGGDKEVIEAIASIMNMY